METISNIASTATTTVSNLIYGDQTKKNETAGQEPISGQEGKGTAAEPYDQGNAATPLETEQKKAFIDDSSNESTGKDSVLGEQAKDTNLSSGNTTNTAETSSGSNDFLKLNPTLDGPANEDGTPKVNTNTSDSTNTGMPIVPLNPDDATLGVGTKSSSATETTGATDKAAATDKVWKETALDDISRSGAPGAGPPAPDSVTASSETYSKDASKDSKVEQSLDGSVSPKTATSPSAGATGASTAGETKGLVGEKSSHKSESSKPVEPVSSSTSEEKSSKMSHLKGKLKDKLHIGSKDK